MKIFQDLNFTIQAGQTVAIVGHTGCGSTSSLYHTFLLYNVIESTIIQLILRFYNPKSGQVSIVCLS